MNHSGLLEGNRQRRLQILPTLLAVAVIGTTLRLGFWQLDRARQKDAVDLKENAALVLPPLVLGSEGADFKPSEFRLASAEGEWVPEKTVFLDNQVHQGRAGFDVLMPIKLVNSNIHVLVNRGWVASGGDRSHLPEIATPQGRQRITGFIRERTPRVGSVGIGAKNGNIWSEVTPAAFAAWAGFPVQPLVLYQTSAAEDGLIRDWRPSPGSGADRNRGYAVQWFAMALVTAVLWGYYGIGGKAKDDKVT